MASKAVVKAAGGAVSLSQKYTLEPTGVWARVRRAFALDPNRSSGVPLNPTYRWPTPGGTDPMLYDDPVTVPAGDIADNPYWKRDARRAYPTLSFVNQGDAVALLGDLVGEAGEKALAVAKEEGQKTGLAEFFEQKGKQGVLTAAQDLFVNGLPPMPSGQNLKADGSGAWEVKEYELLEDQSYGDGYPCRTFK
ncbi:21 kDa subunit of NADH dehydrogenase [Apiospora kogelbergensis]|uniref:21 kDa subunit of NADH dehydrogenase n=1 Tax=Apiospora kogelbergensis TaxID=1337665 RepID=A0AAW0QXR6_9PEZI